jgi:hypothetical protein
MPDCLRTRWEAIREPLDCGMGMQRNSLGKDPGEAQEVTNEKRIAGNYRGNCRSRGLLKAGGISCELA